MQTYLPLSLSLSPVTDENKPQLDHIQADFVTSAVLGVAPHHNHKSGDVRRLNGVIPRMNITPNPLAQDPTADKVSRAVFQLCSIYILVCYSSFHRFHLLELQKQKQKNIFAGWLVKIRNVFCCTCTCSCSCCSCCCSFASLGSLRSLLFVFFIPPHFFPFSWNTVYRLYLYIF